MGETRPSLAAGEHGSQANFAQLSVQPDSDCDDNYDSERNNWEGEEWGAERGKKRGERE